MSGRRAGKRKCAPDSIQANLEVKSLIHLLVNKEEIKPGDKPSDVYNHPTHATTFAAVAPAKFRAELRIALAEKYGEDATKRGKKVFYCKSQIANSSKRPFS